MRKFLLSRRRMQKQQCEDPRTFEENSQGGDPSSLEGNRQGKDSRTVEGNSQEKGPRTPRKEGVKKKGGELRKGRKKESGAEPGEGLRARQLASLWCGLGRRTSASQGRSCDCCAGTFSTRGECSSKDVWRSRSRPSRPSCQGPSGVVVCFCVLYCRMR